MYDDARFLALAAKGLPTGEVVSVNRFLVSVRGLGDVPCGALIYFQNGHQGIVREVYTDLVVVLNVTSEAMTVGILAVLEADEYVTGVGDALLGRVVSVSGKPLDSKGAIMLKRFDPVFKVAPGIVERQALSDPLSTGVAIVDQLFPLVLGQRIAVLGDNKTGKSAFVLQTTLAQAKTNRIVVHVLIAKRRADVDQLIAKLAATGALKYSVVIVATVFDALTQSYLAPYVGATIAEYFWQQGRDCIIVYDDISNHAKVYRELSLLLKVTPGRASYPGDMFYAHSSLLERAGRLSDNGATLTAIPVVLTPNNDITAPLPTAIMSITDGQLIFDSDTFRAGIRPALSVGLSVSRVGGMGQTARQKNITAQLFKCLAAYRQAAEFSHFGSELADETRAELELGKMLYEGLKQPPDMIMAPGEQEIIMSVILKSEGRKSIDVEALKKKVIGHSSTLLKHDTWDDCIDTLLSQSIVENDQQQGVMA